MRIAVVLGPIAGSAAEREALGDPRGEALYLVNDPATRDGLRAAGLWARTLTEHVPTDSPGDFDAYDRAHREVTRVERSLDGVLYGDLPIGGAIEAGLVTDLVFFYRAIAGVAIAHAEGWPALVFALTHYNASYAGLAEALVLGGHGADPTMLSSATGIGPLRRPLVDDQLVAQTFEAIDAGRPARSALRPNWLPPGSARTVMYLLTNDADLYLKPVYPVIEEFRTAGTPFLVLTEDERVGARLGARGVSVIDVRRVGSSSEPSEVLRRAHFGAAGRLFRALAEVPSDDAALGVLLRMQANDATIARIDEWLRTAEVLDGALAWCLPASVFLMPDAMGSAALVTWVARARAVPTVTTVAASVAGTARALGTYRADVVASYGFECNEAFAAIGWDASRIVLTGAPALDASRARPREVDRESIGRLLGAPADQPFVAVLTSRTTPAEDDWIVELARAAADRGWHVVVKPHPQHGVAGYADVARRTAGLPLTLLGDADVATLVSAADVVVTDYSHAGREALAADRPLVAVNVTGVPYPNNRYDEEGVAVPAWTIAGVPAAVATALTNPEVRDELRGARARSVDRFNWKNDGRAARRVYELLVDPPVP